MASIPHWLYKPKKMGQKEFIKKILDGERDFRDVRFIGIHGFEGVHISGLRNNHNGSRCFPSEQEEINAYLKSQNLKESPLDFSLSEMNGHLQGLHMPYTIARNAKFQGVYFHDSNLAHANLENTDLSRTNFFGANLEHAVLTGINAEEAYFSNHNYICPTQMSYAKLNNANLTNARFNGAILVNADFEGSTLGGHTEFLLADLSGANFRHVKNLDNIWNFPSQSSHFNFVVGYPNEKGLDEYAIKTDEKNAHIFKELTTSGPHTH